MTEQINDLKTKIEATSDFFEKMELIDTLYELEIKAGVRKPKGNEGSYYECVGCSA
jgi:hypothetical protein